MPKPKVTPFLLLSQALTVDVKPIKIKTIKTEKTIFLIFKPFEDSSLILMIKNSFKNLCQAYKHRI